jgi:glycosyltransferase involved in cell wall biosynthesis
MKKSVIAKVGIKNEELIIDRLLSALNQFCDKIIIVDDHSTDDTENICRSYEKVEWHKNIKHDWRVRCDGMQHMIAIEAIKSHNPDYVLSLDADEIPFTNMPDFIDALDDSINLWKLPFVQLWGDEFHHRTDNFRMPDGTNINYNAFNGGPTKCSLFKWIHEYDYKYDLESHLLPMEPYNTPHPHALSYDTGILHYGKLSEYFKSGEKDHSYAVMRSHTLKLDLQDRIKHHENARSEETLTLEKINTDWIWDYDDKNK